MFFSRPSPIIGLDIGTSAVKLAQLKGTAKGFQLEALGVTPLPPEVIVDGTIMDAARVVDAIRTTVREQRIKSKDVALSVSGHAVIVKRIGLPEMTEEELQESIRWEAEQYIPFAIDDVNLDFQILGPSGPDKPSQMDVLLVAVKKDKINEYVSVVAEAELNPVIVDVDAFAVENMYEINYELEPNRVIALVDVGAAVTNINILKNGVSAFTRDTAIGGNQFTEALQKELGIGYEEAEALKREGKDRWDEVAEILRPVITDLSTEIVRSFDFFKATSANEQIDKVVLSGGCAKLHGLAPFLAEQLGVPVEMVNPFKNIHTDPGRFSPEFLEEVGPAAAVCVGLAIRKVGDK